MPHFAQAHEHFAFFAYLLGEKSKYLPPAMWLPPFDFHLYNVDYEPATNLCGREKSAGLFDFACFGDAFAVCLQSGSPTILTRWFRLLLLSKRLPLRSSARRGETYRQEESTAWQRDSLRLERKKEEEKKRVCYTCSRAEEEGRGQMQQGEEKRQGQKAQRSRKPPDTEHRERKLRRLNAGTVTGEEKQKKWMFLSSSNPTQRSYLPVKHPAG